DRGFLAKQRQSGLVVGEFRQDDLDRHGVAGLDVVAAIDFAHAAGGDARIEFVDAAQLRADVGADEALAATGPVVAHGPQAFLGSAILTRTIVTLSVPPRAKTFDSKSSHPPCGDIRAAASISASVTWAVRPSVARINTSPGLVSPCWKSTVISSLTPMARVI